MAGKVGFRGLVLVGIVLWGGGSPARGERLPLPAPLQAKVNQAIDRGVVFLFRTQPVWGSWTANVKEHPVGYAALPGLTLLECGESRDHLVLQRAVSFVRANCGKLSATYDLALALLFLDRWGDPGDEKLIQTLAVRLIAGQSFTGGWSYRCPVPSARQSQQLLAALRRPPRTPFPGQAALLQALPVFHPLSGFSLGDPPNRTHDIRGTTDNSNTQFAALALWAARRHAVPMERTLLLIRHRFSTSQNLDGSWGYHYRYGGGEAERPAMTCVGLLGLAIGHGLAAEQEVGNDPLFRIRCSQAAAVLAFHPRLAFLLLPLGQVQRELAREKTRKRGQDLQILNGFVALNKHLGEPVGRDENIPQANLYFLWSVERVAVLYDLATIGTRDWYRWGAEMIVANQQVEGNWTNGGYPGANPIIDTCLALLFLKRANLVADLTTRLPFDRDALASSILKRVAPPPDPASSPSSPSQQGTVPRGETRLAKTIEPENDLAARHSGAPESAALSGTDSSLAVDEIEPGSKSSWVWLLVLVALLLFITSGILLASFSVASRRRDRLHRSKRRYQLRRW